MASVLEGTSYESQFAPALLAGLRTISEDQVVPFRSYVRYVLPLDGYVYWLGTKTEPVRGSLHVTAEKRQDEDESPSEDVGFFNTVEPEQLWVGESVGVRFAFSRAGPRYKQAGIWHYFGVAVYPALESQLVDVGSQLDRATLVVSNSLPAWLSLVHYNPEWLPAPNPRVTLYPSFAVPANVRPPYGSVHVVPESVKAVSAFPVFAHGTFTQAQLTSERVRVTLYGLTNEEVMDFSALVYQFSEDTDLLGMTDIVAVRDEKRVQAELGVLAMKKTLEYGVSYEQGALRRQARALVEKVMISVGTLPYSAGYADSDIGIYNESTYDSGVVYG
jgi:hypothetical protein